MALFNNTTTSKKVLTLVEVEKLVDTMRPTKLSTPSVEDHPPKLSPR